MKFRSIYAVELTNNKKGDLFCRLVSDLFHALGYDEPRFDVHTSGRELDLQAVHRIEKRIAIAECKAHKDTIGGGDVNKFVGSLDAARRKYAKSELYKGHDITGYFVSLSGYKETAIEQELEIDNDRVILLKPEQIINELIEGKIIVPLCQAISAIDIKDRELEKYADLIAYNRGWVWAIYFTDGQKTSEVSFVHAEGNILVKDLANEIIKLDKKLDNRFKGLKVLSGGDRAPKLKEARKKYFKYLANECGEIHFEGLPTDKDAGSVKVKLENIFIAPSLECLSDQNEEDDFDVKRVGVGDVLKASSKLAILAKPGGGKSTLIKRLAVAYAFPSRKKLVDDELPQEKWFPIFIRCRELGDKVTSSITEIIHNIPIRAELGEFSSEFESITSSELQKGNALLLIDGLDEISDDRKRISFVNQIRTFIATYPNIHIVITSREAGFRAVGGILANYCTNYKMASLNSNEISSLSVKWHSEIVDASEKTEKDALSLAEIIINDSRISALAENPLLLTTLLFVKRWAGYLPTRKSVLYQEMIKLLMVTWNVEGHDQLDIEEAEPQLSYVAFWMTLNGVQTITLDDLKSCLYASRKQMPDILGYTTVSVPDFIKRVESRSSLLIQSGHEQMETGEIVPIYEFLHLSFQEYLTAKAVVEGFLPANQPSGQAIDIIRPHIADENWKEVIPLVAVLLKRGVKDLILCLIEESKNIAKGSVKSSIAQENQRNSKVRTAELLGNCIASEIQITPDLLEDAIEWYAKCGHSGGNRSALGPILSSKFGDAFRNKLDKLYSAEFDDAYAPPIGSAIGNAYIYGQSNNEEEVLADILKGMDSSDVKTRFNSLFGLMTFSFQRRMTSFGKVHVSNELDFTDIVKQLIVIISSRDLHLCFPAFWSIAWFNNSKFKFTDDLRVSLIECLLECWVVNDRYNLNRMCAWGIKNLLRSELNLSEVRSNVDGIEAVISERLINPVNKHEKCISIMLGFHFGFDVDKTEATKILRENRTGFFGDNKVIDKYASKMGIDIRKKKGKKSEISEDTLNQ